jgi:hypothetical protein
MNQFGISHWSFSSYTFEQIRQKVKTKNSMQYYSLLSSIPKHIRENLTDCFNTFNPEDIFLERIKNNKDIDEISSTHQHFPI